MRRYALVVGHLGDITAVAKVDMAPSLKSNPPTVTTITSLLVVVVVAASRTAAVAVATASTIWVLAAVAAVHQSATV